MWGSPKLFHRAKSIEKILRKNKLDTINGKNLSLDPLNTNNTIYRDWLA